MIYLQITLDIDETHRGAAAAVYTRYKARFLETVVGAQSKQLLVRNEDVQVLHGFETDAQAFAYLESALFRNDVVRELGPLLNTAPDVRIYAVA